MKIRLVAIGVFLMLVSAGVAAYAVTSGATGRNVTQVQVLTSTGHQRWQNPNNDPTISWETLRDSDLVGPLSTTVTVPSKQRAILLVTASLSSQCLFQTGGTSTGPTCLFRVVANGTPLTPGSVIYDQAKPSDEGVRIQARSYQFVSSVLGPGTYTIEPQFMGSTFEAEFDVYNTQVSIMRIRV